MKKYFTEGIGTFFLVLFIFLAGAGKNAAWSPLVYGLTLMTLALAACQISGAYFNPAVSLAAWISGRLDRIDIAYYWAGQAAGALLAALLGSFLIHCDGMINISMRTPGGLCVFFGETLGAFLLTFTALASGQASISVSRYGLAIGASATAGTIALGNASAGGFNPALALGLCIGGQLAWSSFWIVLAGALLGAAAAASLFRILNAEEPTDNDLPANFQ